MTLTSAAIEPSYYRDVMGRLPTGVVVVAGPETDTGGPAGLVVGTFQSLSLNPPLVSFSVANTSSSWPKVRSAGRFSASVLASGQDVICRVMSSKGGDKFAAVNWHASPDGAPRISGAHAWIDCATPYEWQGGDHIIVIANVLRLTAGEGGEPLVFHRGRLGGYRDFSLA